MESNDEMVDRLVERGIIESDRVEQAFRNVDRKDFVPEPHKDKAYADTPLPIAGGSVTSQPSVIAENTELLDVGENDRVIEIGSGSGYQVALLAELTDGEVIGVDIIEEVIENSRERLDYDNVKILHGNGFNPVEGEFDRILYSCAIDSFDEARRHLTEDGIIVAPVYVDHGQVLRKYEKGEITDHSPVRFMPFEEEDEGPELPEEYREENL
ncbi:methyltransferase domain-containing protein [Candidatus Nanohaloarchaea archaeon]|nr:methyltransferase domain-containing protein [Candidatus Nanohaloarchaea archaeon]